MDIIKKNKSVLALSLEERSKIQCGIENGISLSAISRLLGRGKNTVITEVRINGGRDSYNSLRAHESHKRKVLEGRERMKEKVRSFSYECKQGLNERIEILEMQVQILSEQLKDLYVRNSKNK